MRQNRIRDKWQRGEAVVNGWLSMPSSLSAEVMAHAGWDSLTIDMQHGAIDYSSLLPMITAIYTSHTAALVRVPWLDPGIIMKALDAGADGVICPMVNTRAEAEAFVSAMRYPPEGTRSYGPVRASIHGGSNYYRAANASVLAIAMIETREALGNLNDILSVPGLDALYVGPADLSLSLGYAPGFDREEPEIVAALDEILSAAARHKVVPCIHNRSAAYAKRMIAKGFRLVTISSDLRMMANAAEAALRDVRE